MRPFWLFSGFLPNLTKRPRKLSAVNTAAFGLCALILAGVITFLVTCPDTVAAFLAAFQSRP